jgi:hypothetical protein
LQRKTLTDYDRYKLMKAKQMVRRSIYCRCLALMEVITFWFKNKLHFFARFITCICSFLRLFVSWPHSKLLPMCRPREDDRLGEPRSSMKCSLALPGIGPSTSGLQVGRVNHYTITPEFIDCQKLLFIYSCPAFSPCVIRLLKSLTCKMHSEYILSLVEAGKSKKEGRGRK